jgi:hypothetical protein
LGCGPKGRSKTAPQVDQECAYWEGTENHPKQQGKITQDWGCANTEDHVELSLSICYTCGHGNRCWYLDFLDFF